MSSNMNIIIKKQIASLIFLVSYYMGPSTYHQFWNLVYPSITSPTHHYAQLQRVPLYLLPLGRGPSNARAPTPSPPIATIPMSLQCIYIKGPQAQLYTTGEPKVSAKHGTARSRLFQL